MHIWWLLGIVKKHLPLTKFLKSWILSIRKYIISILGLDFCWMKNVFLMNFQDSHKLFLIHSFPFTLFTPEDLKRMISNLHPIQFSDRGYQIGHWRSTLTCLYQRLGPVLGARDTGGNVRASLLLESFLWRWRR